MKIFIMYNEWRMEKIYSTEYDITTIATFYFANLMNKYILKSPFLLSC